MNYTMVENILNEELEKKVFSIVREYLNENRYFQVDKIIPYMTSRLSKASVNINSAGIVTVLESLAKKHLIVEGSKLSRDDVLENNNRKKIYVLIKRKPGINFNKIASKLNMRYQVLEWHLKMLIKFKFIKIAEIGGKNVYFFF